RAPAYPATATLQPEAMASRGRRNATRLRDALPGGVGLWAKSRRRPKAGGHSPKGLPGPATSAQPEPSVEGHKKPALRRVLRVYGSPGWIRTTECLSQSQVPYHLATGLC